MCPRDAVPVNTHGLTLARHRVPSSSVVEHPTRSRRVVGSNPIWDSEFFRVYVSPRIYIINSKNAIDIKLSQKQACCLEFELNGISASVKNNLGGTEL